MALCLSDILLLISALITVVLFLMIFRFGQQSLDRTKLPLPPEPPGGLPIVGHLFQLISSKKSLARAFADLADRHGPIFTIRLGVHRYVIVSDSKTVQECFATHDKALASRPWSSQAEFLNYHCAGFATAPYGTYWRDIRKLAVTQLLAGHRLKALRRFQVSEINMLMRELHVMSLSGSKVVMMSEVLEQLGLNMITRLIAGKRYFKYQAGDGGDDCGHEEGERIGRLMRDFMRVCGQFVPSDFVPLLGWMNWLPAGPLKSMKQIGKELDVVMQSWIDEHKQRRRTSTGDSSEDQEGQSNDFIDVMLSEIEDDFAQEYSPDTIMKATALTLILAGADTTSITIIWILSNLLKNRRILELAQQELDVKVGKSRLVEHTDIDNLIYLQAIVKETLRMYPPAPTAIPHQAMQDCTIHGYHMTKGTRVFANLWKLHRDPNVWADPDEFKPERFLVHQLQGRDNNSMDLLSGKNFELVPFGSGRRSCPGAAFALQVVHLTMGRVLQGFDISNAVDNQAVDMGEGQGLTMPKATPLEVKIVSRLSHHLYQIC